VINKKLNFSFVNCLANPKINKNIVRKKKLVITKKIEHILKNLNNKNFFFHSLSKIFKPNFNNKDLKKFNKYVYVAIVGMGGSILGSKAINQFLNNKIKKKFLFFDNLKESNFKNILNKKKFKKILFIIISKSGNTMETLINLNLLTKFKISASNTIVVTENKNSILRNFAKRKKILIVEHNKSIGGRYSVLSEVGMLPAHFMNLSINSFKKNSLDFLSKKNWFFLKTVFIN